MQKWILKKIVLGVYLIFTCMNVQGQTTDYGRKMVEKLSSRAFKGRGYTKKGDRKAALFIAKQFKKNGALPFASNNGKYLQDYQVAVHYFPGRMKVKINKEKLKPGIDYLIDATSPTIKGRFNIIVGKRKELLDSVSLYGLMAKAANAFLYIDNTLDSTETKEEKEIINQNLRYIQSDSALPIKGMIVYSPKKLTWTVLPYTSAKPLIELHSKIENPTSIQLKIDSRQEDNYETQNIAGFIRGSTVPDSFIVISAHYDHLGMMGKRTIFYGANDNASGTGFILELMRYFQKNRPKYSIAFLNFSGEELGLKGSEYYVHHPLFDLKKIKFLCNFDMAGTGVDGIQVVNSSIYTQQYNDLKSINDSLHLLKDIKLRGAAANSDHYWFYKNGVPSFFMYTLGGINYHDVNDTYSSLPFSAWNNYLRLIEIFISYM